MPYNPQAFSPYPQQRCVARSADGCVDWRTDMSERSGQRAVRPGRVPMMLVPPQRRGDASADEITLARDAGGSERWRATGRRSRAACCGGAASVLDAENITPVAARTDTSGRNCPYVTPKNNLFGINRYNILGAYPDLSAAPDGRTVK